MKIETDEERAEMHALADLLVHGLPESDKPITQATMIEASSEMSTMSLLKKMSELSHTQRRATPSMFRIPLVIDVEWKREK
jgi:hypothetical protein